MAGAQCGVEGRWREGVGGLQRLRLAGQERIIAKRPIIGWLHCLTASRVLQRWAQL